MEKIKLAIFDLGNVIFKVSFNNAFNYWASKSGKTIEDISNKFLMDEMYELHEINKISIQQYKEHVCKMMDIDITLEDFINGWNSIYMNENEGIRIILSELKKNMKVVALSNTNETHCVFTQIKYLDVFKYFEKMYFSHHIQCRKPEKESFNQILSDFQLNGNEVIFFDDLLENIEGAKKVELKAIHVINNESIIKGLQAYGIDINK